jgi:hypothetical protein
MVGPAKKSFSARIDAELYQQIVDYCQRKGDSQADFLAEAAKAFFESGRGDIAPPVQDLIEAAIAPLRLEVAEIREELGKFAA